MGLKSALVTDNGTIGKKQWESNLSAIVADIKTMDLESSLVADT